MSFSPSSSLGFPLLQQQASAMDLQDGVVSKPVAVSACVAMALLYVASLYAPTVLFRLPPPSSLNSFMIRRFLCAAVSTVLSLFLSALILPVTKELPYIFGAYGIRGDHIWQAVVLPLSLTSLMYAGSMFNKFLLLFDSWMEHTASGGGLSFHSCKCALTRFLGWLAAISSDVLTWRFYVVAPLTEELVFRACMIPLLLCGGFKPYNVMLLCPIFFSLGLQLGYTVIFGSYASFLFIRTGHLAAPLVAHIYCNFMGLPVLYSERSGIVSIGFIMGFLGFLWLLYPVTGPDLYNDRIDNCNCWQGYCSWKERIQDS
ncbi:CAAX prenyl protease 2 isoform X2 [Lotus japonicus]|uniref:CAAX prenyl protease 2 isoform X2 n=1 Tax=Lotus japonicus TaxID=34305 RepID=UPI00258D1E10|nr:CAAX prenyl protease 2 isoform X2 [Lotus japonicus]